ncbi:MAG: peptidylprolyl isomerase [Mycobacteriales bacterium]|nr:peptidylprolyl isomerase [Mycobacteriales bacterium]
MTRTPRRLALGAAGLTIALALTGCGGQVRTGAAAIVGDERISAEQLQEVVERGTADPAAAQIKEDLAGYQRTVLTRLINRVILERALADAGVEVSEGDVDKQLQVYVASTPTGTLADLESQAVSNGIAKQDLRDFVRSVVLDQALGDVLTADVVVPPAQLQELYAQNPGYDRVRSAHILVPTQQQAASLLAQVKADPTQFAALAKRFSTDTSNKDKGGDLGLVGRGSFVKEFEDAVFAGKVGDLLTVKTQFGFHVISIVERQTTTLAQATPELRRQALEGERTEAKSVVLRKAAADLGIRVSPRFGTWSSESGEVVERESELSVPADSNPLAPDATTPEGTAPDGAPDGTSEAPAGS